jgi:hypothetical protein
MTSESTVWRLRRASLLRLLVAIMASTSAAHNGMPVTAGAAEITLPNLLQHMAGGSSS